MSISYLEGVIPPPVVPIEAGPVDKWPAILKELKINLPDDYRDFGLAYGTGRFCNGFVEIYNPFSEDFASIISAQLRFLAGLEAAGMKPPFNVYPEKEGIFPVGRDENGNSIYLLNRDSSGDCLTILRSHENGYETHHLTLTQFLAQAFSNSIQPLIWHEPFNANELTFETVKPRATTKPKKRRK